MPVSGDAMNSLALCFLRAVLVVGRRGLDVVVMLQGHISPGVGQLQPGAPLGTDGEGAKSNSSSESAAPDQRCWGCPVA